MNRIAKGGIVIVPGHHDQDDVAYFQALWDTLSIPEPSPPALPSPPLAARAIRASLLSPGSLSALKPFAVGSQHYQPGEFIDCNDRPTLAEALVRFGYASRLPITAGQSHPRSTQSAKERLKKALASLAAGKSASLNRRR
jgi:hypothetical protein